jgi:hypothetical protein
MSAFPELSDAEFLRYVAQNDYMIDQHYLPTGERLMQMAEALEQPIGTADLMRELNERGQR